MENRYEYLFPFERIAYRSKIVIYGAGRVGTEYLRQILLTKYCTVEAFIDRNFKAYSDLIVQVYPIEKLKELEYDYILIAMKSARNVEQVLIDLNKINVKKDKIIFVGGRRNIECYKKTASGITNKTTDKLKKITVAISVPNGIGDCVVAKRFVVALMEMIPNMQIDIYGKNPNFVEIMEALYGDLSLHRVIPPKENRYDDVFQEYMLAIEWKWFLQIDKFDEDAINLISPVVAHKLKKLSEACIEYNLKKNHLTDIAIYCRRVVYAKATPYTFGYYKDILGICDSKVNIPLKNEARGEFDKLGIDMFITINYGNGPGSTFVSKQWPLQYFEQLVKLIHKEFPQLSIVQVGSAWTDKISECDQYILGGKFEVLKWILKKSLLHIDIEGGLVHIATQLGTKCVVLFGPTMKSFFSYEQNINISNSNCNGCWFIYDSPYICARNLLKPECMYSIVPNLVMEKVRSYLLKKIKDDI